MKALAVLLLASLPVPQVKLPALRQPQARFTQQTEAPQRKGGKWFFARTGHAVYCYGPVMTVSNPTGDIEHVATFCRGDRLLVPLKD